MFLAITSYALPSLVSNHWHTLTDETGNTTIVLNIRHSQTTICWNCVTQCARFRKQEDRNKRTGQQDEEILWNIVQKDFQYIPSDIIVQYIAQNAKKDNTFSDCVSKTNIPVRIPLITNLALGLFWQKHNPSLWNRQAWASHAMIYAYYPNTGIQFTGIRFLWWIESRTLWRLDPTSIVYSTVLL